MSRLIVSGCSFTNYWHPTWAWFMSSAYDETYNYGQSGAGNEYIYHSIIDADTDLELNENDTVVIAWSGYSRFDQFRQSQDEQWWYTSGDWIHNPEFKSLEQFVSEDGWARKSVNYIAATARYLKSKNIKYVFTSLYDLRARSTGSGSIVQTDTYIVKLLADIYDDTFIFPRGLVSQMFTQRRDSNSQVHGGHPNLSEHQLFAIDIAFKLGISIVSHTDLERYDSVIDTIISSNSADLKTFGKALPLMNERGTALILTKPRSECIPATTEKYYRNSLDEYKKLITELFIK